MSNSAVDPDYKSDTRCLFFEEPRNAISAFMQMPTYLMTSEAATQAYMKDWRASRRAKLITE